MPRPEQEILHLRCGDDILPALRNNIPGQALRWADPLCDGPPRRAFDDRLPRAQFLATRYGEDEQQSLVYLTEQDAKLEAALEHAREITLWFEHDLFDQIILIYLLDRLAEYSHAHIQLIQLNQHPAIRDFRGLGQLNAEQLSALYPAHAVPADENTVRFARTTWQVWCNPEPQALANIALLETAAAQTAGLPYLCAALRRHLQDFPSVTNGLDQSQQLILKICTEQNETPITAAALFREFSRRDPLLGAGDLMFWPRLADLAYTAKPVLEFENAPAECSAFLTPAFTHSPENFAQLRVRANARAADLLAGQTDFIELNGIDCWRGGVHQLSPHTIWRWHAARETMLRT